MLPLGQTIALHQITTDRYGRTIAEAYRKGRSVGLTLVSEGYAVVYDRYLNGCSETEGEYLAAEEQAKAKRSQHWSQEAIVMPWEFRWGRGVGRCIAADSNCWDSNASQELRKSEKS